MKKSVIVLLMVIYVAAIVFVNYFGMEFLAYDKIIYAESVECINSDMKLHSTGEFKYAIVKYAPGVTYTIQHKVYPENVTNKNVTYVYDENNGVTKEIWILWRSCYTWNNNRSFTWIIS